MIFLVIGISFHYGTKHVPSFFCLAVKLLGFFLFFLMTHAEKSSDPTLRCERTSGHFPTFRPPSCPPVGFRTGPSLAHFGVDGIVAAIWDIEAADFIKMCSFASKILSFLCPRLHFVNCEL